MATDNVKDVALNLKIAASGGEQVRVIADALEDLAKEGGSAAPEIRRLSETLRDLGQQSGALQAFRTLDAQVAETTEALTAQRDAVSKLRKAYDDQETETSQLAQKQKETKGALDATKEAIDKSVASMRLLKSEQAGLLKGTQAYNDEEDRLTKVLANQRNARAEQKRANDAATAALAESNAKLKEAAAAYGAANREADAFERTLSQQRAELEGARSAMAGLGVEANTLAQAEEKVAAALNVARQAVDEFVTAQRQAQSISEAVAAANERAVTQAKAGADARSAAAKQAVDDERVLQQIADARALAEKLATEQELSQRKELSAYVSAANDKAVAQAKAAAAARVAAAQAGAAAEKAAADQTTAAAQRQAYALQQITDNIKSARNEAQSLADRLQAAFSKTGTKAVNDLRQEVVLVREAMDFLKRSGELTGKELAAAFDDGNRKIRQLELQIREATGQLTLFDKGVNLLKGSFGQFAAGFILVEAIQELGRQFLKANNMAETLARGLNSVYKDARITADQIAFLNKTAKDGGIEIAGISGEFVKFSAAMQSAGFGLQVTNALFKGVANEASNLGLSTEKVGDILNALGQIASKGTVQLEELKNQLGDALPGALKRTADALGITLEELLELTSSGRLLATDVLPALANALGQTRAEATTMTQVWANLKNAIAEVSTQVGDTGVWDTLKVLLLGLSQTLSTIGFLIAGTFDSLTTKIRQYVTVIASAIDGDLREGLRQASELEADFIKRSEARWNKLGEATARNAASYDAITMGAGAAAQSVDTLSASATKSAAPLAKSGAAATASGDAHADAAVGVNRNAAAQTAAGAAATTNAAGQLKAGAAAEAAGKQAADSGNQWIQLGLAAGKVNAARAEEVKTAALHVEAVKEEARVIEALTKLSINQETAMNGLTEASRITAAAEAELTLKRIAQLNALIDERNEMQRLIPIMGDLSGARGRDVEAIELKIAAMTELVEKDKQSVESSRLELEARKLAAEVYRDNSARLAEFREAADKARERLDELTKRLVQGRISQADYAAGVAETSRALALERDAFRDTLDAIRRKTDLEVQANKTRSETIETAIATQKAILAVAKANDDESTALRANVKIRQLERELQIEQIATKERQIRLYEEYTAKLKAEYEALGPLSQAQQDELTLRSLNVEAMKQENLQRKEGVKAIDAEVSALQRKTVASREESSARSSGSNKPTNNNSTLSGSFDARNKSDISTIDGPTYDKDGFATDSSGNRITAGTQLTPPDNSGNWEFISDATANAGRQTITRNGQRLDAFGVARQGYWIRKDGGGSVVGGGNGGPGAGYGGLGGGGSVSGGLGGSIGGSAGGRSGATQGGQSASSEAGGASAEPAAGQRQTAQTVYSTTLVIDGVSRTVNVGSLADQRALEAAVRNLAEIRSRSGAA